MLKVQIFTSSLLSAFTIRTPVLAIESYAWVSFYKRLMWAACFCTNGDGSYYQDLSHTLLSTQTVEKFYWWGPYPTEVGNGKPEHWKDTRNAECRVSTPEARMRGFVEYMGSPDAIKPTETSEATKSPSNWKLDYYISKNPQRLCVTSHFCCSVKKDRAWEKNGAVSVSEWPKHFEKSNAKASPALQHS